MKLNVTKKILLGYVVVLLLMLAYAALTYFNGKKIEATTVSLSAEKIPALITVSHLKSNLQTQTIQLYELYATNDVTTFQKAHAATAAAMLQDGANLQSLPEFKPFDTPLALISAKQESFRNQFLDVMRQPEVDWDKARAVLSSFSASAAEMSSQLDQLVSQVSDDTLAQAKASQQLTEQLINLALSLAGLVFLGVLLMSYYSHKQVIVPLNSVSSALSDVTTRHDLTYRLKRQNDDEIGAIASAANHLLAEFQQLARTLDGTAQNVNRTTNALTKVTRDARASMAERNANLRGATEDFMREVAASSKQNTGAKEADMDLHQSQMKFIDAHLKEINQGIKMNENNEKAVLSATTELEKLAENMQSQIRLLNF
jgi:methyl-accepting chemotaxis protein